MTERLAFAIKVGKIICEQIIRRVIMLGNREIRRRNNSSVKIVEADSSKKIISNAAGRRISEATPYNAVRDMRMGVI